MKIIKAREIKMPDNLYDVMDKKAGVPVGTFVSMSADNGKLHQAQEDALTVCLGVTIEHLMTTENLPEEPMSERRFNEMFKVVLTSYVMGTMEITEEAEVRLGSMSDSILFIAKAMKGGAKFQFRSGKVVDSEKLLPVISALTSTSALKEIYKDIKGLIGTRKKLKDIHALKLAMAVIETEKKMQKLKIWE